MKSLLFLESSPHGHASRSARLAASAMAALQRRHPGIRIVSRSLAQDPPPPISAAYARAITGGAPRDAAVFAESERLIRELEDCNGLLICTPMHNFTVPAALKLWIDHVLRMGRTMTSTPHGKAGLLADRPTLVLVRAGSRCAGEDARQPDFLTPYLGRALAAMGIHRTRFAYLQGPRPAARDEADALEALAALFHAVSREGAAAA
ncbi:hypothetical protein AD428_03300 [Achromobacter sp. DMS1]|uniref:FMN-dependent NADH-azoreductase n=1 Tax=Achromobacter sp. DMS1 TaxID=1688405 RepID=UPI00069DD4F8|nr:NAD(P)H-dependent oxidoreductase [Achromobacter sp. DMS1]KOF55037.1 hypothetical protein AD428_03300 [Achromobacter sp. DMS1]